MNKLTIYYTHDHENDTKIEYSLYANCSSLTASFTSEDPDYGTETIHFDFDDSPAPLEKMAQDLLTDISEFLDMTDNGMRRNACPDIYEHLNEYNNTTLYAVEGALRVIIGETAVAMTPDGNIMTIVTVREASRRIKESCMSCKNERFDIGVAVSDEIGDHPVSYYARYSQTSEIAWFGVMQIMNDSNLFNGDGCDSIIMVGMYGGGNVRMAYFDEDCMQTKDEGIEELVSAICEAADVRPDEKVLLEIIKTKEEK